MSKAIKLGPVHATPYYTVKVRGESSSAIMGSPEHAAMQVECYLSSRPRGVVDVLYGELCASCKGSGRVAKRGRVRFAYTPCKVCKGSPDVTPEATIDTVHARICSET